MSKKLKIDTNLLKKLSEELDVFLASSQEIKDSLDPNDKEGITKLIIELQKASGLASGVAHEAAALVMDITQEVRKAQGPSSDMYSEALDKLLKSGAGGFGGYGGGSFN